MEKYKALELIDLEHSRAVRLFGKFKSPHEGLAIILEEYEELKAEVFQQPDKCDKERMAEEAKHIAAMALRFMIDLT